MVAQLILQEDFPGPCPGKILSYLSLIKKKILSNMIVLFAPHQIIYFTLIKPRDGEAVIDKMILYNNYVTEV